MFTKIKMVLNLIQIGAIHDLLYYTGVKFWQQRYQDGLEKMHLWMAMYGGDPTTVLDEENVSYGRYPDEWNRGR